MQRKTGHQERVQVQAAYNLRGDKPLRVDLRHVDFPGWEFTLTYGASGEAYRFEITTILGPSFSARLLHAVPFGELNSVARRELARVQGALAIVSRSEEEREHASYWAKSFQTRPGRRGRSSRDYAELARAYVGFLDQPTPTKALAEAVFLGESRVANLLSEARRRGLLTSPPPGKAGGRLTAKAKRLLSEGDDDGTR